jgi:hypothetical protein
VRQPHLGEGARLGAADEDAIGGVAGHGQRMRPPLPTRSAPVRPGNLPFLVERLCPSPAHTHSRLHSFGGNRGGNSGSQ